MTELEQKLKVLVGDDHIGREGPYQRSFLRVYSFPKVEYDFASTPKEYLAKAKKGNYYATLVDLNWTPDDHYSDECKTGYRMLEEVRPYIAKRILHSSDPSSKAYEYGATAVVEKNRSAGILEKILLGE